MAKASAPPGVPTPICRIEVVKAAVSPSLRAKKAVARPQELGPNYCGVWFIWKRFCKSNGVYLSTLELNPWSSHISKQIHSLQAVKSENQTPVIRIRESEKLKTVLELYDLETHQKKLGPDYYRLKTMVKRSIEQEIRNKNFGSRNGNFEKNAVVKNQGTKQREQRILGDCWQWKTNGQCVKGNNCSFATI